MCNQTTRLVITVYKFMNCFFRVKLSNNKTEKNIYHLKNIHFTRVYIFYSMSKSQQTQNKCLINVLR